MKRFPAFAAAFLTVLSLAGCGNLSAPQNEDICPGKQVGAEGVPVMKAEGFDETEDMSFATVYKGNIIKNLIMDCQSYTKYRPNETTGGIFVSWRRKEELPTGA